jgi:hypothetical protein
MNYLNAAFNDPEIKRLPEENRQKAIRAKVDQQLIGFAQNFYFALNVRKHTSIFDSAKIMVQETSLTPNRRYFKNQKKYDECKENIKTIEENVIEYLRTMPFPKGTEKTDVDKNEEKENEESQWGFETDRFYSFLRDEVLRKIFVSLGNDLQFTCKLDPDDKPFVADRIQAVITRFSNDEDGELLARLMLVRMRLILRICFDSTDSESAEEVINRINSTLNEVGFSELAFSKSDEANEDFISNDNVFDWVICESLHRMLPE